MQHSGSAGPGQFLSGLFSVSSDSLSSPALCSDSGQETGGCGRSVPCQDAFHELPGQFPAQGCPLPPSPGCCSTHIPAQLCIPGPASGGDIPLEMGRLCSGRPEKSRGQRGEVMVAASGVISLQHLRGPLSDSAVVCGCPGQETLISFTSAAPFLPCPALLRARAGGWSLHPFPGVPSTS